MKSYRSDIPSSLVSALSRVHSNESKSSSRTPRLPSSPTKQTSSVTSHVSPPSLVSEPSTLTSSHSISILADHLRLLYSEMNTQMEYATRETQLRETTLRALDSLWTEVKILREWRASVEGRLESLESSSHSQEASSSRDGLVHSPSKETHASSPATDGGQHQASSTESSPPSSLSLSVLPPNSTGITTVFTRVPPGLGVVLVGASLTSSGSEKLQISAGLADSVRIEWPPIDAHEGSGSSGDLVIGFQVYVNDLPALMAYGRHRRSVVIDSLEAGILYSIRVQRVSRDGSVIDVPTASTSNTSFLMLVHIETQANAAGDSEAAPPAALFAQQIDSAKRRFESQIEDAQKAKQASAEADAKAKVSETSPPADRSEAADASKSESRAELFATLATMYRQQLTQTEHEASRSEQNRDPHHSESSDPSDDATASDLVATLDEEHSGSTSAAANEHDLDAHDPNVK